MTQIIIVFASMTGNTEEMADEIAQGIREQGCEVDLRSVMDASANDLLNYDGIILGAYTWGDGDLPDEFLDFYDEMDNITLQHKKAAVFGSCDSNYTAYGAAVDILHTKLDELGASVILQGLKIELSPSASEKEVCREFGKDFAKQVLNLS